MIDIDPEPLKSLPRKEAFRPRRLSRFLSRALQAVGTGGEVSVLLTGDRRMRSLNRKFRHRDRATDVLSFPAAPQFAARFAGDLAISLETAARQAAAQRHTIEEEIEILILHGLLHLAGYDHESDSGRMARRERVLRKRLSLPSGLIERGGYPAPSPSGPRPKQPSNPKPKLRSQPKSQLRSKPKSSSASKKGPRAAAGSRPEPRAIL